MRTEWTEETPLLTDYERHQALLELDVLVAQMLGMTCDQLVNIYRIQFPVFKAYEDDTWYDAKGRIVFSAKNMGDLIYKRPEFEKQIKNAADGETFERSFIDKTASDVGEERSITYYAPFDVCSREEDYCRAWDYFMEKYKK